MGDFEVFSVKIETRQNRAAVTLRSRGTMVSVHQMPFDPPGDQTESQLEAAALKEAKKILRHALEALEGDD